MMSLLCMIYHPGTLNKSWPETEKPERQQARKIPSAYVKCSSVEGERTTGQGLGGGL